MCLIKREILRLCGIRFGNTKYKYWDTKTQIGSTKILRHKIGSADKLRNQIGSNDITRHQIGSIETTRRQITRNQREILRYWDTRLGNIKEKYWDMILWNLKEECWNIDKKLEGTKDKC